MHCSTGNFFSSLQDGYDSFRVQDRRDRFTGLHDAVQKLIMWAVTKTKIQKRKMAKYNKQNVRIRVVVDLAVLFVPIDSDVSPSSHAVHYSR